VAAGLAYRFARAFCVRLAGVPFEVLESLGTPEASALARQLIERERALDRAFETARGVVEGLELDRKTRTRTLRALWQRRVVPESAPPSPELSAYAVALEALQRARAALEEGVATAQAGARDRVWRAAAETLPDFLVIESEAALAMLARGTRDPRARRPSGERSLAMYLQRVCAKNDTISRFGPIIWGGVGPPGSGLVLAPRPGIGVRFAEIERWVIAGFVSAMNADPEVRPELCPRLQPNGAVEGAAFVRHDRGDEVALGPGERALLARCDGRTPAHALDDAAALERLAGAGVLVWEVEIVAWDVHPLATLLADVRAWREGPARARWIERLEELEGLATAFLAETGVEPRRALVARARAAAAAVGAAPAEERSLYQASNPIVEECIRVGTVSIGPELTEPLLADLAPWMDLYRDTFSLAASYGYRRLRELHAGAPRRGGVTSLAAFMAHCEANGLPLRSAGLSRLAAEAYAEVKRELRAAVADRADAPEWQIGARECHVLRRREGFATVDEGSWVSPDLQIAAASTEAVARGDYTWIVAELHTMPVALFLSPACLDPDALDDAFRDHFEGRPWLACSRVSFGARNPVHYCEEPFMTIIPNAVFSAPERPRPDWRFVPPSETEIVVLDESQDVRARARATGEDLGSLVRPFWIFHGYHPFYPLEIAPHTPRLRIGKTVVQRETWTVGWEELQTTAPERLSADHVLAVERLRARLGLPRWVYVRPGATRLARSSVFGRSRDVKPLCIDLESTVFIEIFLRRLHQYEALEIVEMMPMPGELPWREASGRYSFEIRAMCPPAQAVR
jgi:hypothetical protein